MTTENYTLSLHDALPISGSARAGPRSPSPGPACRLRTGRRSPPPRRTARAASGWRERSRSEEHTSELQSQFHLVCRLLLEKKKKNQYDEPQRHILTLTV